MASVTPMELELIPVLIGALFYAVYTGLSALRRSQTRRPVPDAKLASDTAFAVATSIAEPTPPAEPCAEPCTGPATAEDASEPAGEPGGPLGRSPREHADAGRQAPGPPAGASEAQLTQLKAQAHVGVAHAPWRPPGKPSNLKHWLVCLAITLWGCTIFVEQVVGPAGSTVEDALIEAAEPSSEFLEAEAEDALIEAAEPSSEFLEAETPAGAKGADLAGTGQGADELAASGYSVDASGLVTLPLTRQQMTIQNHGEVTYHKSAYWGTVYVGSPAVPFKVVFDTGSGHLVLPSSYCHSDTCRVHKRYRRSGSSSAQDIDYDGSIVQPGQPRDQITVSFGTGEVTGVFMEETVCMDSAENTSASVAALPARAAANVTTEQDFPLAPGCFRLRMIAATAMSEEPFKTFNFDGVLGLGLDGLSQSPEFNLITTIAKTMSGAGGSRIPSTFAVFLGEHKEESEITIGGWAQKHMVDDELVWRPVHDPELGHWLVEISALYVDDHRVSFCDDGEEICKAVVDTGTSLMAVPTPSFPELFELLRHQVSDDFECTGPGPNLHFELGGIFNITLEPQDYARTQELHRESAQDRRHREEFGAAPAEELTPQKMAYCKPMLMSLELPAPIGPRLFILGEPVLRKYYTVYDAEAKRVGFGRAKHDPPPAMRPDEEDDEWFFEEDEE